MADAGRRRRASDGCLAHHRDTPPVDEHIVGAGLLARGSSPLSGLPEAAQASVTLLDSGSPLTVAGAAPASPASLLAPDKTGTGEPRRLGLSARQLRRQPLKLMLRRLLRVDDARPLLIATLKALSNHRYRGDRLRGALASDRVSDHGRDECGLGDEGHGAETGRSSRDPAFEHSSSLRYVPLSPPTTSVNRRAIR
ncbi:hypothetical protein ACVIHI_000447 [Bradyrhizobium sp. USDA 4524]|nr:hypothetical protein [Bradyrhizobium sp. USDA 4538]MCP1898747.1 hypothetical protein [Bradyrhizobium sp. USDA 4537]MCP1987141.1 hypothetical protein [Bradyrhizobium sp. USDA 4539]